jgi:hypothetical protein
VLPSYVAVSVIEPALTPLTSPADTVATALLDDDHVAADVTFSEFVEPARTTNAEYCDEAPTPGGVPAIDSVAIVDEGSAGVLLHAPVKKTAARMKDNFTNRVSMLCPRERAQSLPAQTRRQIGDRASGNRC